MIWQDAKDLVSGIKYENNYVSFTVKKETIHNGNAIIAVRDNAGTILWSWHIWVTERDLHPVEVENFQHAKYKFLPVNLGWCGFGNELYALREVKVRITQTGGKMKEFTLIQEKNSKIETDGDAPFYQWGRKDPILPSDGTTKNHDKTYTPIMRSMPLQTTLALLTSRKTLRIRINSTSIILWTTNTITCGMQIMKN